MNEGDRAREKERKKEMERDRESVYCLSEELCLACLRQTRSRSSNLIDDEMMGVENRAVMNLEI